MAIAYDTGNDGNADFSATMTISVSPAAVSNRFIAVLCANLGNSTTTIDSATYNSVAMTAFGASFLDVSSFPARGFYLAGDANIATGAHNVVVTLSNANAGVVRGVVLVYNGVDGSTPIDGYISGTATSSAPSWTVSTGASGDMVAALFAVPSGGNSLTAAAPAVKRKEGSRVFTLEEAGAASVTINGTLGFSDEWRGFAFNMNVAGGGGGGDVTVGLTGAASTGGHGSVGPGISVALRERLRRFISLPSGVIVPRRFALGD